LLIVATRQVKAIIIIITGRFALINIPVSFGPPEKRKYFEILSSSIEKMKVFEAFFLSARQPPVSLGNYTALQIAQFALHVQALPPPRALRVELLHFARKYSGVWERAVNLFNLQQM
jgi:hypothetical protein